VVVNVPQTKHRSSPNTKDVDSVTGTIRVFVAAIVIRGLSHLNIADVEPKDSKDFPQMFQEMLPLMILRR